MGFDPHRGPGKRQQGVLMPIEPQQRKARGGPRSLPSPQQKGFSPLVLLSRVCKRVAQPASHQDAVTRSHGDTDSGGNGTCSAQPFEQQLEKWLEQAGAEQALSHP